MPRKPKSVPTAKISDIEAALKKKAATPKTISLSDLVKSLAQPIQEMLDAGYSYSDVADVFKGHGVELAASGIRSFHKKANTTFITDTSIPVTPSDETSSTVTEEEEETVTVTVESSASPQITPSVDEKPSSSAPETPPLKTKKPSSANTAKSPKSSAKTHPQFNVTDRSNV